jgi:hypothetical protein
VEIEVVTTKLKFGSLYQQQATSTMMNTKPCNDPLDGDKDLELREMLQLEKLASEMADQAGRHDAPEFRIHARTEQMGSIIKNQDPVTIVATEGQTTKTRGRREEKQKIFSLISHISVSDTPFQLLYRSRRQPIIQKRPMS